MLFPTQHLIFIPLAVFVTTTLIALAVAAFIEMRARQAEAAKRPTVFRPVLVHDRAREMLVRSATRRITRPAAPRIRVVYNGG